MTVTNHTEWSPMTYHATHRGAVGLASGIIAQLVWWPPSGRGRCRLQVEYRYREARCENVTPIFCEGCDGPADYAAALMGIHFCAECAHRDRARLRSTHHLYPLEARHGIRRTQFCY